MTASVPDYDIRAAALTQAVAHHAGAMRAVNSLPTNAETVVATAKMFTDFIKEAKVPELRRPHTRKNAR